MPTLNVAASVAGFPEGVSMTPAQFLQWLVDNSTYTVTGAYIAGQVDGSTPASNVGVWIRQAQRQLLVYDGVSYKSLLSVPIGAMLPWPAFDAYSTIDSDYLECLGQQVLQADYPLLNAVLGSAWNKVGDTGAYFRLPAPMARVPCGSGFGSANPHETPSPNANGGIAANGYLTQRSVGQYFGLEWPTPSMDTAALAPTPQKYINSTNLTSGNFAAHTGVCQPSFVVRWIIRAR